MTKNALTYALNINAYAMQTCRYHVTRQSRKKAFEIGVFLRPGDVNDNLGRYVLRVTSRSYDFTSSISVVWWQRFGLSNMTIVYSLAVSRPHIYSVGLQWCTSWIFHRQLKWKIHTSFRKEIEIGEVMTRTDQQQSGKIALLFINSWKNFIFG
jgi:hypothetical protein